MEGGGAGEGKLGSFTRMGGVVVRREGGGGERERHALENNLHLFRGITHKRFSTHSKHRNMGKMFYKSVGHFPSYSGKFALDSEIIFH